MGSDNGEIAVISLRTGKRTTILSSAMEDGRCWAASTYDSASKTLYLFDSTEREVCAWPASRSEPMVLYRMPGGYHNARLCLSHDNQRLYFVVPHSHQHHPTTELVEYDLTNHTSRVLHATPSLVAEWHRPSFRDEKTLLVEMHNPEAAKGGFRVAGIQLPEGRLQPMPQLASACLSPDGTRAFKWDDQKVQVYDSRSGTLVSETLTRYLPGWTWVMDACPVSNNSIVLHLSDTYRFFEGTYHLNVEQGKLTCLSRRTLEGMRYVADMPQWSPLPPEPAP